MTYYSIVMRYCGGTTPKLIQLKCTKDHRGVRTLK